MAFEDIDSEEDLTLPGISEGEILVIRSARRKRNISAYRQGGRIIVSIPGRMSKADEHAIVPEMIAKIRSQESERTPSEERLMERTHELMASLAPEISARPASINWRKNCPSSNSIPGLSPCKRLFQKTLPRSAWWWATASNSIGFAPNTPAGFPRFCPSCMVKTSSSISSWRPKNPRHVRLSAVLRKKPKR